MTQTGEKKQNKHLFDGRVFRLFFSVFSKFVISSFLKRSDLSIFPTQEFVLSLSWFFFFSFFGCVCVSVFFKRTLCLPLMGSAGLGGWTPQVAGLGQGAGPRLLRGSLCLKPLRMSYCISQGAGWGLAEGFLVAASPAGAPLSGEEGAL